MTIIWWQFSISTKFGEKDRFAYIGWWCAKWIKYRGCITMNRMKCRKWWRFNFQKITRPLNRLRIIIEWNWSILWLLCIFRVFCCCVSYEITSSLRFISTILWCVIFHVCFFGCCFVFYLFSFSLKASCCSKYKYIDLFLSCGQSLAFLNTFSRMHESDPLNIVNIWSIEHGEHLIHWPWWTFDPLNQ